MLDPTPIFTPASYVDKVDDLIFEPILFYIFESKPIDF